MRYRIFTLVVLITLLSFLADNKILAYRDTYVRIAIMKEAQDFDLVVSGSCQIIDANNNSTLYKGRNLKTKIIIAPEGFYINSLNLKQNKVIIKPKNPDSIRINGRRFREDIVLIGKQSGILVINVLNLEDYLKGVLYHEISHYWPMEAIKAQAVVSRTFALYQINLNKNKEYDMTCDIYSQVYGGRTSERWRTTKAVNKTKGLIIKYKNEKNFPAFFHATCAGMTEDVANLWNIDSPALEGVPCNYCSRSPHFNWQCSLSFDKIRTALNESGYKINIIKDIIITARNKTGRVTNFEIFTDEGSIDISGKDFRNIIGPNIIRSLILELEVKNKNVRFHGSGWGHGVGMCQWGAYFMAKKGKRYEEIIQYYYPGVRIGYAN